MSIVHALLKVGMAYVKEISAKDEQVLFVTQGDLEICVNLPQNTIFLSIFPSFQYFLTKRLQIENMAPGLYTFPTHDPGIRIEITIPELHCSAKRALHNLISQRATLLFGEQQSKKRRLSRWLAKGKKLSKTSTQFLTNLMRDTQLFLVQTLVGIIPGYLLICPMQCTMRNLPTDVSLFLVVSFGTKTQKSSVMFQKGPNITFSDHFLFRKYNQAAVTIEVWYNDISGDAHCQGTAVLELDEVLIQRCIETELSVNQEESTGSLFVRADFVREADIGTPVIY